ncbi:hypothetical protein AFLA70_388g000710 [Aspergillus flavus AF70]|nr:hypothetical protein AFLA70_388g000710 [Aspergillus flavus AF70]
MGKTLPTIFFLNAFLIGWPNLLNPTFTKRDRIQSGSSSQRNWSIKFGMATRKTRHMIKYASQQS